MYTVELPVDLRSPNAARRATRHILAGRTSSAVEDAALMTSVLVTNAVLAARQKVRLSVSIDGDLLLVEVSDDSVALSPSGLDVRQATGRGLQLVDALADMWGIVTTRHGQTVWFEFTLMEVATDEAAAG